MKRYGWERRLLIAALLTHATGVYAAETETETERPAWSIADPVPLRARYLLVGPDGGAVSDEDFRGSFQLITFGYTFCPDICPTTLVDMAEALRQLDGIPVQGIFITVDPQRDTREVLKTYTGYFDPRILGLGGSPELIARAAANFKVRYERVDSGPSPEYYAVDHSAGLYLLDKNGQFLHKFAYGAPPEQIAAKVRAYAAGE